MADEHWFDALNKALVRDAPRRMVLRAAAAVAAGLVFARGPDRRDGQEREETAEGEEEEERQPSRNRTPRPAAAGPAPRCGLATRTRLTTVSSSAASATGTTLASSASLTTSSRVRSQSVALRVRSAAERSAAAAPEGRGSDAATARAPTRPTTPITAARAVIAARREGSAATVVALVRPARHSALTAASTYGRIHATVIGAARPARTGGNAAAAAAPTPASTHTIAAGAACHVHPRACAAMGSARTSPPTRSTAARAAGGATPARTVAAAIATIRRTPPVAWMVSWCVTLTRAAVRTQVGVGNAAALEPAIPVDSTDLQASHRPGTAAPSGPSSVIIGTSSRRCPRDQLRVRPQTGDEHHQQAHGRLAHGRQNPCRSPYPRRIPAARIGTSVLFPNADPFSPIRTPVRCARDASAVPCWCVELARATAPHSQPRATSGAPSDTDDDGGER